MLNFSFKACVLLATLLNPLASFSQSNDELDAKITKFFNRHNNYQKTLALEKDFYEALKTRNKQWLIDQSADFLLNDFPIANAAVTQKQSPENKALQELALKMGPCEYASLSLYSAIAARSEKAFPKKMPAKLDNLIDQNMLDQFSEHMRRCELVYKHPKTQRLIGKTLAFFP
jgi:hypothetical protein